MPVILRWTASLLAGLAVSVSLSVARQIKGVIGWLCLAIALASRPWAHASGTGCGTLARSDYARSNTSVTALAV